MPFWMPMQETVKQKVNPKQESAPMFRPPGSGLGTKAVIALGFLLAAVLIGYLALTAFKSLMPSYTPKEKSSDSSVYTATDTYENKGMTKVEPNRTIIIKQGTDNTAAVIPLRPTPEAAEGMAESRTRSAGTAGSCIRREPSVRRYSRNKAVSGSR